MMTKLSDKQREICKEAGIEKPDVLETAKDLETFNESISILKDFLKRLNQKQSNIDLEKLAIEQKEAIELATALIASLQQIVEGIKQREQTKSQLNKGKNKPKSVIEKLFEKLQKGLEKEGAIVSWLSQPQGKEQKNQIVTIVTNANKEVLDVTKKTIKVQFKDGPELHVHPTGVSVPDPKQINKDSILQIAKTVEAAGMKNVTVNKEVFPEPEKNRNELFEQLCNKLRELNVNVLNAPKETQEKKPEQEEKQENTTTLKK